MSKRNTKRTTGTDRDMFGRPMNRATTFGRNGNKRDSRKARRDWKQSQR